MPEPLRIFAPAKINLFLRVTGKRADGYHTLQSLMAFADAGDVLSFSMQDDFSLAIDGPFAAELSAGADNLVIKAARLLAETAGVPLRGCVTLTKNLPIAAGIGGGSSDAAAALKGLAQLWGVSRPLHDIALKLGADVPACLEAETVVAEGIGDILSPVSVAPLFSILVNPRVPTPTAEVFRHLKGFSSVPDRKTSYTLADIIAEENDLTSAALVVTPVIKNVLQSLGETQGCRLARLSGSGATCFGIFDTATAAKDVAKEMSQRYPHWWIVPARIG